MRPGWRYARRALRREGAPIGVANRLRRTVRRAGPWPLYRASAPSRRFVIVTAGRTGSELLLELLDSHPDIVCDSEILAQRRALPHQFIARRAALARLAGARAYGFKLVRDHILIQDVGDPAGFLRSLPAAGIDVILLERRDLLQQALSHIRASRNRYHVRRGDDASFAASRVDPVGVLATMYAVEDAVAFARQALADLPHLPLVYEDHLVDASRHQETADLVSAYLGLDSHPVHSDLVKIPPSAASEQVENFDELAGVLSLTRYAQYLDGVTAGSA